MLHQCLQIGAEHCIFTLQVVVGLRASHKLTLERFCLPLLLKLHLLHCLLAFLPKGVNCSRCLPVYVFSDSRGNLPDKVFLHDLFRGWPNGSNTCWLQRAATASILQSWRSVHLDL